MLGKKLGERVTDLNQIKQMELELLELFTRFCHEHHLKYVLGFGTLLGAVRHKGFIPWDDDIDVVMPRPDYEKFLELWQDSDDYVVLECRKNKEYIYPFAKLCNANTFMLERETTVKYDMGLYIDIFVFDALPDTPEKSRGFVNYVSNMEKQRMYSMMPCRHILRDGNRFNLDRKIIWRIIKAIGPHHFSVKMDRISQKYSLKNATHGAILGTRFPDRQVYPADSYEDRIEMEFEGKRFFAPRNYDMILKHLYGNYMELPPEEQRTLKHNFKLWKCC